MARIIDADKLILHLADWQLHASEETREVIEEAIRAVDEQPTVKSLRGIKAISDYLYIGTATFRRHADEIPHYRIGRQIFADAEVLDEWMHKQRTGE